MASKNDSDSPAKAEDALASIVPTDKAKPKSKSTASKPKTKDEALHDSAGNYIGPRRIA